MDNRDTFRFEYYGNDGSVTTTEFDSDNVTDVLKHVQKFLQGCGYHFVGELIDFRNPNLPTPITGDNHKKWVNEGYNVKGYELDRKPLHEPKWDFSNIPNNNWLFDEWKPQSIPALTTADISKLVVDPLNIPGTKSVNQYPTMAPLTSEQVFSWRMEAPGTLGGAKVSFDKDAY